MKKQLVLVAGLAVLATPAFASKARLQALGEDLYGSLYINDNRNIFINAAAVNDHKDLVTYEWGSSPAVADTAGTPRAEGGFFKSHGNFVYGVQLGGQSDSAHLFRAASGVTAVSLTDLDVNRAAENNGVEIFLGGDAGVKWGASLYRSKTENDDEKSEQESMRVKLGVSQGNWSAFANINLKNDADNNVNKFEGDAGYQVGGTYMWNDYTFFGEYRSLKGEADIGLIGEKFDQEITRMEVGVGRQMKLNDKATLFTKVSYRSISAEGNAALTNTLAGVEVDATTDFAADGEFDSKALPVVVGVEHAATSWLTLRTSLVQNVLINSTELNDGKKVTNNATTAINAGASLLFGDTSIDAAITSGTANNYGRVSATYRF